MQSLSDAQIATLRAYVLSETDLASARQNGDDAAIAAYLNADSTKVVWPSVLNIADVRKQITYTELTGAEATKLNFMSAGGASDIPISQKVIQGLKDIFHPATSTTWASFLAEFPRKATRAESKLLATGGQGTAANPGFLGWEGMIDTGLASLLR